MRTIHKFQIPAPGNSNIVTIDTRAKPLMVGLDPTGHYCIWFEVDTMMPQLDYRILTIGTGHEVPQAFMHAGSFTQSVFVWHVYYGR